MQCNGMPLPLHEQLHGAWERSGWSLEQLRLKAMLDCSADSLSRKLRGKQVLSTAEAESLATALDHYLKFDGRKAA
jgi:hypothetical protein